ncbi:hypothetical protein [Pseudarthrobacter sp. NBSH8]|uniref:hypothetical protein n=1 Tax=Pseudarthrobacter sp. NBSH8 TaxID=2596911 RepID=UPI001627F073|nr:hypothetical protein [Pseudarthrobacter sp. NBSH8]QNE14879.1 hypothetical protein FYJ92_10875 [Pseudarthrobacter sp. NBSH8]
MQADPGIYAPLQYSQPWLWSGLALLAVVLGWYTFVFLGTRKPRVPEQAPRFTPRPDLAGLKEAYLQRIDAVTANAAAGLLTARESHQELSLLVRRFARAVTGIDAPRMTLAELHGHPLPPVAEAVRRIYPGEFGLEPLPPVAQSAETARQAVWQWN